MKSLLDNFKYVDINTPEALLKTGEVAFLRKNTVEPVLVHWRDYEGIYHAPIRYAEDFPIEDLKPEKRKRGRPKGAKNKPKVMNLGINPA